MKPEIKKPVKRGSVPTKTIKKAVAKVTKERLGKNDWMNVAGKGKGSTERFIDQFSKGLDQTITDILENMTIDDILRGIIEDSDLIDVACCLDMIAQEDGKKIILFSNEDGRIYPAPGIAFPDISLPEVSEIIDGKSVAVKECSGCDDCSGGKGKDDSPAKKVLYNKDSSKTQKTLRGSALSQR